MKRSEINTSIEKAQKFAAKLNIHLPSFAFWPYEKWHNLDSRYNEIKLLMLGWDVTDFGLNDYFRIGRTLFTLRNGSYKIKDYPRTYSEKYIFIEENQASPVHFHRKKTEDIINRAGGNIIVRVCKSNDDKKSDESFELSIDGVKKECKPDQIIRLTPGESILIPAGIIHEFWSEEGTGMTLSGEIGTICDDVNDNVFLCKCERFSSIEEDETPKYSLCNEYPPINE